MTRDPRKNPKPGDAIRKGTATRVIVRTVTRVERNNIYYTVVAGGSEKCAWITTWQTWAKDAAVVALGRTP